jgi:hypothetical protein
VEQLLPDTAALPIPQATPAGDARAAAHLLGEHLPGDAASQDEDDAGQAGAVIDGRPAAAAGSGLVPREEGFDNFPKFIGDQGTGHGCTSIPGCPRLVLYGADF